LAFIFAATFVATTIIIIPIKSRCFSNLKPPDIKKIAQKFPFANGPRCR
jgi:hypothetical protein